jgi:methylase of polypeptide subunit release factors
VQRHSPATLDLGAGSGKLSLGASLYSDVVVATDLNQGAVACFIAQKQNAHAGTSERPPAKGPIT